MKESKLSSFYSSDCFGSDYYRKFPTDISALLLGDLYYTRLSVSGVSEHLSHSALLEVYQILHANLSSNVSKVAFVIESTLLPGSCLINRRI